ncbi:MAG: tetratricopeptide repeat protein, partial [Verrucomicrobiota bacterium]|nr:tetratricopeptide repeat protein [Verrucomicrobiota bacterium]
AIDVLKDAIKANPKAATPYLQLAYIYAKYLKKNDQAVKYANEAVALDPQNIETYQRLYEIETAVGDAKKALSALDRAKTSKSEDPAFWTRLGKLYATTILKDDVDPKPEELRRINDVFQKAAALGKDDVTVLKDVADFYAASRQIEQAIPLYLRVLELQPDDASAREKLATGFVLTNQRAKAIAMLQEIISAHPEKYQPYDLLAQLLDDDARALARANDLERAKAQFAKAAENYEQSLLINPNHPTSYLRLGELLVGPLRNAERAMKLLLEARGHFPDAPEFTYLLAITQREAKQPQLAIATFAEALHEATESSPEMVSARFYFDYAVAADQAGLHDKAAELLRQSISLDPAHAAEAYNYLGYMWAEQNAHLDEAEDAVKHALQLEPSNGAYLDSLGWLHFRAGKFNDALDELLRAAQNLKQSDPVVFEHIADTYAKLSNIPQALEFWGKALALDPGNKALAEKIEQTKTKMSKGPRPKMDPTP